MQRRLFTLEEANRLVPWLERTFRQIGLSMEHLEERRERLNTLQRERQRQNGTFQNHGEIRRVQDEVELIGNELKSLVDNIAAEGIIVRDIGQGLIDFPHMREGREVYLCWIKGEESITFWHETDRGFIHRQPL